VLYLATGDKYIQEAIHSARSVKETNPDLSITILTDTPIQTETDCFDNVIRNEGLDHQYGLLQPDMFPYDRTLFLDTDTYICENISDLFNLLNDFDLAVTHSPGRPELDDRHDHFLNGEIPDSFPLYNSGVIAYADNKRVQEVFTKWNQLYEQYSHFEGMEWNQPSFRAALYMSDVDLVTLHKEYNCRFPYPNGVTGDVKILHGRVGDEVKYVKEVADRINTTDTYRVHTLEKWPIHVTEGTRTLRYKVRQSIRQRGVFRTLAKAPRYLYDVLA
jgi:hypothetical protein